MFIRLEYYSLKKLKKEILEIVGRHLNLNEYKVFFFGSRVTGKGNDKSDIDIGIEGKSKLEGDVLLKIAEEIEDIPTLYKIDVIDFSDADENFKQVAKQKIEFLN